MYLYLCVASRVFVRVCSCETLNVVLCLRFARRERTRDGEVFITYSITRQRIERNNNGWRTLSKAVRYCDWYGPVSYTHLTLPTIYSV